MLATFQKFAKENLKLQVTCIGATMKKKRIDVIGSYLLQ